jgi:chemotaxis signal transduction protein
MSLLLKIEENWYQLPSDALIEVCEGKTIYPIPNNPSSFVHGLMTIRGLVAVVIGRKKSNTLMLVIHNGRYYALYVDEVGFDHEAKTVSLEELISEVFHVKAI